MLDEAQELALIRSVLVDTFPEESRRVGKTNLNDIVRRRGQVRIVPMSGASRLEWAESLILLAQAAVLVNQWMIQRAKAKGWIIHFHPTINHVHQTVEVGNVVDSQVNVTGMDLKLPPEIADKLDAATRDRLISSFLAHLDAMNAQGSSAGEHG